ncbi:diguanylate cyclase [Hydrogenivirga caldilitoris]|uniref:diguanylate cyclase n=1 Tax=Hydrogenivirga caldilitoris TaxID=246264 RepID=A0A497XPS9_9AQUI|nr:GGDEF domain-containing protein [Hydrogenivirga caldilitoris]RLJ71006.1 diguanylate cyclase [Hydrogenivirga caldilitoris]
MRDKVECELHRKIVKGEALSEEDYKVLSGIVKEVLTFMAKEKILPSPQNYERWFRIFCYAKENNLNLSKSELIDLYFDLYQVKLEKGDLESASVVERIAEELFEEIQKVLKSVSEHDRGLSEGGQRLESMVSSVQTEELQKLLNRIMHEVRGLKSVNRKFIVKLEEQRNEIERLREELRRVKEEANVDPLTGLRNRRSFERALNEFYRDFKKFGYPFSLIMLDLDNFKQINDTYGHLVGDRVLREIGNILRNYLRAKDVPARTGGEEFTIILPGITKEEALMVAERLRKVISNHIIEHEGKSIRLTSSFGVAEMSENIENPEDLLRLADQRLYKAKREGKNKVVG